MSNRKRLDELITLSVELGKPGNDYVILGEGNTSARANDETFWVKASGKSLNNIDAGGFVQVDYAAVITTLDSRSLSDSAIKQALREATIGETELLPSVETMFHAVCLFEAGAEFVGHTHPTAVNAILCSQHAKEAYSGRIFPDEIVVCGPEPVFIPYTDPGLTLSIAIREGIRAYQDRLQRDPKLILLQNHGMIALGRTASEVQRITAMAVKVSRILQAAYAVGGPNFLSAERVARIDTRPDEHYRQRMLEGQ
ncbi:MAG: class II aldolase [Chloroflexi bacterium]|nr:class II aldolase [Chloroflexota bacterium]